MIDAHFYQLPNRIANCRPTRYQKELLAQQLAFDEKCQNLEVLENREESNDNVDNRPEDSDTGLA